MSKIQKIKKELKRLRKKLIAQGENENNALNIARATMNQKYGRGWRTESDTSVRGCSEISPSGYEEHVYGEHWMD